MGKVTVHPTGHVEVDIGPGMNQGQPVPMQPGAGMHNAHGHPGVTLPTPDPGVNSQEGHVPSPADGAKAAMDAAFARKGAPIQKPDATRAGSMNDGSKRKPDASAGKGPPGQKTKTKGDKKVPKGGAPKESDDEG